MERDEGGHVKVDDRKVRDDGSDVGCLEGVGGCM